MLAVAGLIGNHIAAAKYGVPKQVYVHDYVMAMWYLVWFKLFGDDGFVTAVSNGST